MTTGQKRFCFVWAGNPRCCPWVRTIIDSSTHLPRLAILPCPISILYTLLSFQIPFFWNLKLAKSAKKRVKLTRCLGKRGMVLYQHRVWGRPTKCVLRWLLRPVYTTGGGAVGIRIQQKHFSDQSQGFSPIFCECETSSRYWIPPRGPFEKASCPAGWMTVKMLIVIALEVGTPLSAGPRHPERCQCLRQKWHQRNPSKTSKTASM